MSQPAMTPQEADRLLDEYDLTDLCGGAFRAVEALRRHARSCDGDHQSSEVSS